MATQIFQITTDPTDVIADQSLEIGKQYSGQYVGKEQRVLKFVESVTVPETDAFSGIATNLKSIRIIPKTGEGIYLWSDEDDQYLSIHEVE